MSRGRAAPVAAVETEGGEVAAEALQEGTREAGVAREGVEGAVREEAEEAAGEAAAGARAAATPAGGAEGQTLEEGADGAPSGAGTPREERPATPPTSTGRSTWSTFT